MNDSGFVRVWQDWNHSKDSAVLCDHQLRHLRKSKTWVLSTALSPDSPSAMLVEPRMLGTQEKGLLHFFFAEGVTPPEVASPHVGEVLDMPKRLCFFKSPRTGDGTEVGSA